MEVFAPLFSDFGGWLVAVVILITLLVPIVFLGYATFKAKEKH